MTLFWKLQASAANKPAAGKAGISRPVTVEHHWPGLPEPERWTAMNPQHLILSVACLGLFLTACRDTAPERGSQVASSFPSQGATAADHPTSLIELTGGHDSVCGRWHIVVSPEDGSLHTSKLSATGSATISPYDWRVSKGAFVFVEGDQRVWAYDGRANLFMLAATTGGLISYGPHSFPCGLPDEVASRLPSHMREVIRER